MADLRVIDGSHGEGGGQILRTALSLSIVTARGFRLENIRANRRNPGLRPQHLAAVRAAATVSGAAVSGDALGSAELTFAPGHTGRGGDYVFDVAATAERGSAGSATLILQPLVLPLALSEGASTLLARGETHVDLSPPFDYFANSYLPALCQMGFCIDAQLNRWGWCPAGGGGFLRNLHRPAFKVWKMFTNKLGDFENHRQASDVEIQPFLVRRLAPQFQIGGMGRAFLAGDDADTRVNLLRLVEGVEPWILGRSATVKRSGS